VETPEGEESLPVRVVTDPRELRPVRWVLLAVKAYDTQGAADWLSALCDENTTVLVLQNGVEQAERVTQPLPGVLFLPTLVYMGGERLAAGRVRVDTEGRLDVPASARTAEVTKLFRGSGIEIRVQPDLLTAAWRKLLINVAINPITALTLRRMEVLRDSTDVQELARALMREAVAVGVAAGARLTDEDVQRGMDVALSRPAADGTSMLYDRLQGRPLEYEALNGSVVRHAQEHGIDVPLNRAMVALLAGLDPHHGRAEEPVQLPAQARAA
jgi:2-dehydropantoate 2-reductase